MDTKRFVELYVVMNKLASETGSRVYGNARPDSDYDIVTFVLDPRAFRSIMHSALNVFGNCRFDYTNANGGCILEPDGTKLATLVGNTGYFREESGTSPEVFTLTMRNGDIVHIISVRNINQYDAWCYITERFKYRMTPALSAGIDHKLFFNTLLDYLNGTQASDFDKKMYTLDAGMSLLR